MNKHKNNKEKKIKNKHESNPPPKNKESDKEIEYIASKSLYKQKNKLNKKDDIITKIPLDNNIEKQIIFNKDVNSINNKIIDDHSRYILNSQNEINSNKSNLVTDNCGSTIKINNPMININENNFGINDNNDKIHKKKPKKSKFIKKRKYKNKNIKNTHKMETLQEIINKMNNKSKIDKINKLKFSKIDSDIQDLDYEDALIYDKRSYLRIYWGFLVDSQIYIYFFLSYKI